MERKKYYISDSDNWQFNLINFEETFQWGSIQKVQDYNSQPLIMGGFEHMKWGKISFKELNHETLQNFFEAQPHLFEFVKENHILETELRNTLQYSNNDDFFKNSSKFLALHPKLDFNSSYEFLEPYTNDNVYRGEKNEGNLSFMDLALMFGQADVFDFLIERGVSYNKKREKNPYGIIHKKELLKKVVQEPSFCYETLFKRFSNEELNLTHLFSSNIEKKIQIVTAKWEKEKILKAEKATFFHIEHIERLFQMKESNFESDSSGYAFTIRKIEEHPEWLKEPISIQYKQMNFTSMRDVILTLNVDSLLTAMKNIEKEQHLKGSIKPNKTTTFPKRF